MQEHIVQGYRLSPQQKRLWSLQQSIDSLPFRAQCAVLIEGMLDAVALEAALEAVIDRNQILRTTFHCHGLTVAVQVISDTGLYLSSNHDMSGLAEREQLDRVEQMLHEASQSPFDCEQGPRLRASLVRLSEDKHILMLTLPALCADSMGLRNLVGEIARSYDAQVNEEKIVEEPLQYIIASEWQNDLFETEDFEVGKSFWGKQDVSALNGLKLPFGRQSDVHGSFEPACLSVAIGADEVAKINAITERYSLSASEFFLACWHILMGRLMAQPQIIVGIGCDGRADEEVANACGLFAKYLPIQPHLDDRLSLGALLAQIKTAAQEAYEWQDWFALEYLAGVPSDQTDKLFFPICFDLEEMPASYRAAGVTFSISNHYACTERFELKLRCLKAKESAVAEFHYNSAEFTAAEIGLLAHQYRKLIGNAVDNLDAKIDDLEMMTEQQMWQLLNDCSGALSEYPGDKCIQELFEEQVELTPDRVAVIYDGDSLTYAGLNKRANQLAHHLRGEGAGAESVIAICLERSLDMVVGVMGILKAGAAYLPMDPTYPIERLAFMIEDAQAAAVLTSQGLAGKFEGQRVKTICADKDWETICKQSEVNPGSVTGAGNLAYLIYTSGSTGKPKGVMVEHQSPINLLAALERAVYDDLPEPPLVVSLNAPLAFDASVQQLVLLMRGYTVQVIPQETRTDGRSLLSHLATNRVDVLDCTPSQLEILLGAGLLNSKSYTPQALLIAGEAIDKRVWNDLAYAIGSVFYNIYGPTECTVDATFCRVGESPDSPSIGRPLANYRLYALDPQLRISPIGVSGELSIGGPGVARGYLSRPELTAEKFIPDPFSHLAGARIYKTGDLGRYWPDGRIEFLGRLDGQVKVRGYRIELGEIESVFAGHSGVQQCAVCVREDKPGDKRLVAYFVPTGEPSLSSAELRKYLQARLPQHMVPSVFVELSEMPLTASGKLDRRALPAPETKAVEQTIPPRDATELSLFHIWSDVLRTENFGIRDNFFDLGGHSLNAVALSSRIGETYGEKMSVRTVFDYPTVELMARYLRQEVALLPPPALVPIQPRGTRLPFFCVHASSGLAHVYVGLAQSLGHGQPFYGLQSFELDVNRIPDSTVEEMATRYLAEVRRVQPVGPYQLGGWSFGAMVAYEMAQQLQAAGEQVCLLAIFDASPPFTELSDMPLTEEEMEIKLHNHIASFSVKNFNLEVDEALSMPTRDLVRLCMSRHQAAVRERGLDGIMEYDETHYLLWFRNQVINTHAKSRYKAKPYPGHVTLFRGNNDREHDYGWSRWALGGVKIYYSDADHPHFVLHPNTGVLAAQLANCLATNETTYTKAKPA